MRSPSEIGLSSPLTVDQKGVLSGSIAHDRGLIFDSQFSVHGRDHRAPRGVCENAAAFPDPEADRVGVEELSPTAQAPGQMVQHHFHGGVTHSTLMGEGQELLLRAPPFQFLLGKPEQLGDQR